MASAFITDPVEILSRREATLTRVRDRRWESLLEALTGVGVDTGILVAARGDTSALDAVLPSVRRELLSKRQNEIAAGCDNGTLAALNVTIDQLGAFWAVLEGSSLL